MASSVNTSSWLGLKRGYEHTLPSDRDESTLYITRDSGKMYLGNMRIGVDLSSGISETSIQQGDCVAGSHAYSIKATNKLETDGIDKVTFTLETIAGLEIGMEIYSHLRMSDHHGGIIESIDESTLTITVVDIPFIEYYSDYPENNYFIVIGHPELGDITIGSGAIAFGESNIAYYSGLSAGYLNHIVGSGGVVFGQENRVGCNSIVSGRYNNGTSAYSITTGVRNTNYSDYSAICGDGNTNQRAASCSLILGKANTNTGATSVLGGEGNNNSGTRSIIFGQNNNNTAPRCLALGQSNTNSSKNSVLLGESNTNAASNSLNLGCLNETSGENLLIGGYANNNSGNNSICFGSNNTNAIAANDSMVIGTSNANSKISSLVLGESNINDGGRSLLLGQSNVNTGNRSLIGGQSCENAYASTITFGLGLTSSAAYQAVFGKYNSASNTDDSLLIIGNGTSKNRSNAFEVTASGAIRLGAASYGIEDIGTGAYLPAGQLYFVYEE